MDFKRILNIFVLKVLTYWIRSKKKRDILLKMSVELLLMNQVIFR